MSKLSFILASTTKNGLLCAQSLLDAGFSCLGAITPAPKPVGRKQQLQANPVHVWAESTTTPLFLIQDKIPATLATQLPSVDFLLVVDFGYYIPAWLINFPRLLAVNVHPSRLPQYRGASPGQHVILHGDPQSAVSIMTLAATMDAGDLLTQIPFTVDQTWTAQDYYQHAFTLAQTHLPEVLTQFAAGQLPLTPQSGEPTFAPKISKTEAYIDFADLQRASQDSQLAITIDRIVRAYNPWPLAWTQVPTTSGLKRLQLHSAHLESGLLELDQVKLEGETSKQWKDLKQRIISK